MCAKSPRHRCLQCFLLQLTFVAFLVFGAIATAFLGVYLVTEQASMLQNGTTTYESLPKPDALTDDEPTIKSEVQDNRSWADWMIEEHITENCSVTQWLVDGGYVFHVCPVPGAEQVDQDITGVPIAREKIPRVDYVKCTRKVMLYSGYASLVPVVLTLLSLFSICGLCLCPILTLAIVYVLLASSLLAVMLYYESSVVLSVGGSTLITFIILVTVLIILGLFHILLFILVSCERKYAKSSDAEKMVKGGSSGEDEDDIDDPKRPLYENGYSPQTKNDFEEKIKGFKYIDDDMSYIYRKG